MTTVYNGTHLFLGEPDQVLIDDLQNIKTLIKNLGISGVIIKFADGDLDSDPLSQAAMHQFSNLVKPFKEAGLKVGGWIYQYLNDVDGEVQACIQAIEAGADWIILDMKSDVAKKPFSVRQFGQQLRSKYPNKIIGMSSYAFANYYLDLPFDQYASFIDVILPQIYWAEIGLDVRDAFDLSISSYKKYKKPIVPVGQANGGSTLQDMAKFVELSKQADCKGISWWSYLDASKDQLNAISVNRFFKSKEVVQQKKRTAADVRENSWNAKAIQYVLNEGLMNTDRKGYFNPDKTISREILAQVIYNLAKPKREGLISKKSIQFLTQLPKDVSKTSEYKNAVKFVLRKGIMTVDRRRNFNPARSVTRGMLAKVVYQSSPIVIDQSKTKSSKARKIRTKDVSATAWYTNAVEFVLQEELMTVDTSGNFWPNKPVTRAMLAQVLFNIKAKKK